MRRAVSNAASWTEAPSVDRLVTGLRACLPADLEAAALLFRRAADKESTPGLLGDSRVAKILDDLAEGAGSQARFDASSLMTLARLVSRHELVLDACLARVRWLRTNSSSGIEEQLTRTSLRDDLEAALPDRIADGIITELLEIVEQKPDSEASSAAIAVLAWSAESPALTERLHTWLTSSDEQLPYWANEILRNTRDRARFKRRVADLMHAHPELDFPTIVHHARSPWFFSGSGAVVYRRIAEEFTDWKNDPDTRIAKLGDEVERRFIAQSEAEAAQAAGPEDHDVDWG